MLCGEIQVESSPGEGARFSLLLPASCGDEPAEGATGARVEAPPAQVLQPREERPSADFGGVQVLLVETDIERLLGLSRLLEGWNLQVTAAGDEEEVREVLEEDGVRLVLLAAGVVDWCSISAIVNGERERPVLVGLGEAGEAQAACVDLRLPLPPGADVLLETLERELTEKEETTDP